MKTKLKYEKILVELMDLPTIRPQLVDVVQRINSGVESVQVEPVSPKTI